MANPQTSQHPTLSKTKHEHSRERTQGSNAGPTTAAFRAEKNRVAAGGGGCRTFDTASRGLSRWNMGSVPSPVYLLRLSDILPFDEHKSVENNDSRPSRA